MVGRLIGRSRVYTLNPAYFGSPELAAYLLRLADADIALRAKRDADEVLIGDRVEVKLHRGTLACSVEEKERP